MQARMENRHCHNGAPGLISAARHTSETVVFKSGRLANESGGEARWHCHREMEFAIVSTGVGVCYVGDCAFSFTGPECVLLGGGLPHCWVQSGETTGYVLHFLFPPDHGIWRLGCEMELHNVLESARRGLRFGEAVAREALLLVERFNSCRALAQTGLLLELFNLLQDAQKSEATPLSGADYGVAQDRGVSAALEATVEWLMAHFNEPITLDEVLRRANMSPATFSRQFKRHTGKTFVEFLNEMRLVHAHQRLTSSRRSIAEIAFESGFNSLSHFGALFRNRYGITPRKARASAEWTISRSFSKGNQHHWKLAELVLGGRTAELCA